jgi:small subunit ribosomal protein S17
MTEETENTENTESTEPTETVETDVETAAQPEGSQPTEVPAAEPEAEQHAEETSPEAPAGGEESVEASAETPAQVAPAEDAPTPSSTAPPTPAAPAGEPRKKRLKHVPRSARRARSKPKREQPATRKPIVRLEKPEHEKGRRQERRGVVVSDAMDKTIVVKVEAVRAHQRYKKVIRRSVKFHAHDDQNQAHVGDRVRIVETRPLSKTKRWRLAEILEVAK